MPETIRRSSQGPGADADRHLFPAGASGRLNQSHQKSQNLVAHNGTGDLVNVVKATVGLILHSKDGINFEHRYYLC
jgi:hypothetical protein